LVCAAMSTLLICSVTAGQIIMQCDAGGCGPLQAGWISLPSCGTYYDVGGTGIDVTLATGTAGACACRSPDGSGALAYVEADLLFADNQISSPDSDFILAFDNLAAGTVYRLLSYHNRSNEADTTIPAVTVSGAAVITQPGSIVQSHAIMDYPAEIVFIPTAGEVSVRYQGPDGGCAGCQAFFNGFVLDYGAATLGFDSASSENPESVSTAILNVVLSEPQDETVTVDYAVTGGTAEGNGVDYTLEADTLSFEIGETFKTISIDIVDDQTDEADETIVVALSNLAGPDLQLGISEHTYTIVDPRPNVSFAAAAGSQIESTAVIDIAAVLSHTWADTVAVDYMVMGGTATGGGADYALEDGTLLFEPGRVTEHTSIDILDDLLEEGLETIELALVNPVNAKLGSPVEHTFTINDNEQLVVLEEFVGNEFSAFNHASSIAETHNGVLVVTWYGGSSEGADDVSIWVSYNDGNGWSGRIEVDDGSGDATWNPVLFQPSEGPLLLFYKYSGSPSSWRGAVRKSYDDGATWSDRILLPVCTDSYLSSYGGRFTGPVKNRPLELPDGSLLCGSSTEHDGWWVHMEIAQPDYTSDYELIGPIGGHEAIQPTFLVHDDECTTIQALCRAPGSGSPTPVTWSYDAGQSWTSLSTIGLETSKGLDAVTINNLNSLQNRWHILAYNPSGRYPLRIATSQDGINWDVAVSSLDDGDGSMDYPAIIQTSDRMLHLTYSWQNKVKIKHVVLNPYILLGEPVCVSMGGDTNQDCVVDWRDLLVLTEQWPMGRCRDGPLCGDFDSDSRTDFRDYCTFAGHWLEIGW